MTNNIKDLITGCSLPCFKAKCTIFQLNDGKSIIVIE